MTQPPEPPPPSNNPYGSPGQPYGNPGQQWPTAQPGGYPAYGGGYPAPPPSGGSGKTIAIIIGVIVLVILLFCGGIIGLIVWAINNVEDQFDDWDPERSGGRNNPISVELGEEFEIDGIEYDAGWKIQEATDDYSGDTIVGLKGTNDRDDESAEYAYLYFTFVDAEQNEVAEITCHSDGSISHGNSETFDCSGTDTIDAPYDHIEVSAS